MTVAANPRGWTKAWTVLAGYVTAGFVLAVLLPASAVERSWIPFDTQLSRSFAAASVDPDRVRLYWAWILMLAPPTLITFSIVAPVKLDAMAAPDKEGSILILVIGFLLLGYIATPWAIYMLFNLDVESAASVTTGPGRFVTLMNRDRVGLFCGGTFLTTATLLLAWISWVAIPTAYFKILRFHRLQRDPLARQRNERS